MQLIESPVLTDAKGASVHWVRLGSEELAEQVEL